MKPTSFYPLEFQCYKVEACVFLQSSTMNSDIHPDLYQTLHNNSLSASPKAQFGK